MLFLLGRINGYPTYVDGEGWADTASRGAGYCPHCVY